MDLLDRIPPEHRERLERAAVTFRLGRGEMLMRRGERGGDVYRVAEGRLEVIDSRADPPVVLNRVGAGAFVGEMAFLDEAMRSADVRAAEESVCQHWPRERLLAMLEAEPALGMSFYRALAELVNQRARGFRTAAMTEGLALHGARGSGSFSTTAAYDQAEQELLEALRQHLMELEPRARQDRDGARAAVLASLDRFAQGLSRLLMRMSAEQRAETMARVARDLHPYLVRSHLGELAMDRPSGRSEDPEAVAHLLRGRPVGDGALGEFIDEWLLSRPTARAFRARQKLLLEQCTGTEGLPGSTLVVNGVVSGLADTLIARAGQDRRITVLEADRSLLERLHRLPPDRGPQLRLRRDDLAAAAIGELRLDLAPHRLVIVDGLADYLPDRAAAVLLGQLRSGCATGGRILLTALDLPPDGLLFHHLLAWPLVQRSASALAGVVARAGFSAARSHHADGAGLVLEAVATLPGAGAA